MVNIVFRKIKELSTNQAKPRMPVLIYTLMQELNINSESLKPFLIQLVALRLIRYNELDKRSVKLTLLGGSVSS